jgi:hypothetical protein
LTWTPTADSPHGDVYIYTVGTQAVTFWVDAVSVAPAGANLVSNPGFETDTSGWTTSAQGPTNGGATLTRDTTTAATGSASGKVVTPGAAPSEGISLDATNGYFHALAGQPYTLSIQIKASAPAWLRLYMQDNQLGNGGVLKNIDASTSWQRFTLTWTPTADSPHGDVYIYAFGTQAVSFSVDAVSVVPGTSNSGASGEPGADQTIAIVDAYDDPNAESDLGVYRSQFGLPPCTAANGCFSKVNQTGGTSYPRGDAGWAQEISLDLDMASAICPNCKILLVEATSNSFANLGGAVDYAAAHANVVSNSYGGSEFSLETSSAYNGHYNHPGVAITASSGDSGYGVQFPAASQYVTAVGGTSLARDSSARGWSETVWSGAGSGCSTYVPKPAWQTDGDCSRRTVADVSADADPNTGVSVYDTYRTGGWLVFGGTSVAAPIIASVYALAGNAGSVTYGSFPYSRSSALYDVRSGSNGSCGGSYLCTAGPGFDGPTGLGTPNGSGAF